VEGVALLVENSEFHDGSSTHVHTSGTTRRYVNVRESVGRSIPVASYRVGVLADLLDPFAPLRSLLEVGVSTSNYADPLHA